MAGCSLETIDTFSASKRSAKKLPIEISVSAGTLDQEPFYIFKNSNGKTIKNLKINPKKTYVFSREKMAESHPFFVSDKGFNQKSSKAIQLKGDGSFNDGITGEESFQLSIRKKYRSDFADSGKLVFYCTSHESMFGDFLIKSGRVQSSSSDSSKAGTDSTSISPTEESGVQQTAQTPSNETSYGGYAYRSAEEMNPADIVNVVSADAA